MGGPLGAVPDSVHMRLAHARLPARLARRRFAEHGADLLHDSLRVLRVWVTQTTEPRGVGRIEPAKMRPCDPPLRRRRLHHRGSCAREQVLWVAARGVVAV